MPQLDQISFLSQLTWLCIFYFGFHLILVDNFLPKISTILKLRSKKLSNSSSESQETYIESDIFKNYDSILAQSVQQSGNSFQNGIQEKSLWINQFVKKLNTENWNKLNNSYLNRLAKIKANQNVIYSNLSTPLSLDLVGRTKNDNLEQLKFQSEQFNLKFYKSLLSLTGPKVSSSKKLSLKNKTPIIGKAKSK